MTDGRSERRPHRESVAAADVAPELVEDWRDGHGDDRTPLPGVPETSDGADADVATVPPVSDPPAGPAPTGGGDADDWRPIQYRRAGEGESPTDTATDTCDDGVCTCAPSGSGPIGERAVADGSGGAVNVRDGDLGDVEFTDPATGVSQAVDGADPTPRPNPPEGVDLDTPGYSIRREMNDVDTPDEKTWFMELDTAVIDAGRCIQCGTCVAACPSDSIGIGEDGLPELVKMCTGCSLCWDFCPRGGLRYERQWKITGGEDNVTGAGDPITEFSARVAESWQRNAQDGGVVTSVLSHLLEAGEIDGALIATESDEDPWKAESHLATSHEELVANAGSFYNQTMALGTLDLDRWAGKLDVPLDEASLALVGTPCEIEGIRALQDFEWEYGSQDAGVDAVEYTIALMCTKNFNYHRLIGDQLAERRGIEPEEIGKLDVLDGEMRVYDHDGGLVIAEDVANFHDAALKGCSECADFTGYCADLTVGSVGSSDEYSSVVVRTERGLDAWELTAPNLDYHDLEDRSAIGKLQGWDKKQAFEALERPFDPDAPRFIEYTDHAEAYGTEPNPHEGDH
jgi:coenzyme F420 hydrogenase subunit beta